MKGGGVEHDTGKKVGEREGGQMREEHGGERGGLSKDISGC